MKQKPTVLEIGSVLEGNFHSIKKIKKNGFDKKFLKNKFNDEDIKQIEYDFNKFFKLVSNNCFDPHKRQLLMKYKNELRYWHLLKIYLEVHASAYTLLGPAAGGEILKPLLKNKKNIKEIAIIDASIRLFFYSDLVFAFVAGNGEKLKSVTNLCESLRQKLSELENKRRTFSIELMNEIKRVETETRNDIPKPTQIECIILANRKTKDYRESDLIDELGTPKQLLISIRDSYKAQKKSL